MAVTKVSRRRNIRYRIRNKVSGTSERPRLSVFKSNRSIYGQIIDDTKSETLVSFSSTKLDSKKNNTVETSKEVGKKLAELATGKGISQVIFDRGGYKYHGQVKALAEGAREGGLKF